MWQKEDEGGWIIPTGSAADNADPLLVAKQQFREIFGFIPDGEYLDLGTAADDEDESIQIWAVAYNLPDDFIFEPYWFEVEWPPNSGKVESFPEMDRIEYFGPFEARRKILPAQSAFIGRLIDRCSRTER